MRRNRASRSARQVAIAIVFLAGDPAVAPLLPAGAAELAEQLLLANRGLRPRPVRRLPKRWVRRLVQWFDNLGEPGHLLHVGLRKRLVDDEARAALGAGIGQGAALGGGRRTPWL